jgi:succinate-semialdehyde dehydrogenase/glutarate-semialdehyde dehydrogenase
MSGDVGDVQLFVDGAWRPGGAGRLDVVDPATEQAAGSVALADPRDLDDALAAADRAFGPWAAAPAHERGAVLVRAAEILRDRTPAIGHALSTEAGRPRRCNGTGRRPAAFRGI